MSVTETAMQEVADAVKTEMVRDGTIVLLTREEATLVRKILQCANQMFTVADIDFHENKLDMLIRKLRRYEDG